MYDKEKIIIIRDILKEVEARTGVIYKKRIDIEIRASNLNDDSFKNVIYKIGRRMKENTETNLSISIASIISFECNRK